MKRSKGTKGFLAHFPGSHIFVTMPEDQKTPPMHHHNGYIESEITLKGRNVGEWNHGVFFTVNELDASLDEGRHRTKKMVVRCRAVFMDDDNPREEPREDFPLTPSLIVNTSPGKYHYYWLTNTDDKDTWQKVQNGLINLYEGDSNAKDLTRYLRLPGYKHNKGKPFVSTWMGEGHKYSWGEILEAFPPQDKISKSDGKGNIANITSSEPKTVDEHEAAIKDGSNYHGSLISLTHQFKKENMPNKYIVMALKGAMLSCSDELRAEDRWLNRFNDIERDVEGYTPEDENISVPIIKEEVIAGEMPWPPGAFGDLAQSAYDMSRFQYKEVAIVSALGLVAGICGRKFNAEGAGLNIYATLIMDTGMGKDSINRFITNALMAANDVGTGSSFIGPVRFTGPRAVYNSLESARSQVCVFTEAGLLLNSKSGDGDGLKRVLLGLYTKSGCNDYSGTEMYSDNEKGVKSLRAPALSIINESTPDMLLSVFKKGDGLRSGDIPRQLIYRVMGAKPDANRSAHKSKLSPDCMDKIKHLIAKCSTVQAVDDPAAWDMIPDESVEKDMIETEKYYVQMQNENRMSNTTQYAMATRAYYKAVRLAAIASVFNHYKEEIHMEEWQWAKQMIHYEMSGLSMFFQGGMGDPMSDLVRRCAQPAISRILNDKVNIRSGLSKKDHKAGRFKLYEFTQVLKNNQEVIDLADITGYNMKSGQQKLIEYMIGNDMLYKVQNVRASIYQVTDTFIAACED